MQSSPPPAALNPRAPPPSVAHSHVFDNSPFCYVVALIAFISVPTLVYAFFFSIRCPRNPFRRRSAQPLVPTAVFARGGGYGRHLDLLSPVKYMKETHVADYGSECPVCLSPYADGERVRRLSSCKHSFHASCVDMWLYSHSNCPVCRASVAVNRCGAAISAAGYNDLHQGNRDRLGYKAL
ncbi:RING-H2 finger protein ATL33-like [Malania oleifera]|uniref:RING-H2 finger protein ATL33-like n=1 Tax=Malania oleifera TaxID=397392 RepID=UPI0025AE3F35|nr:RING-H2 finger protein ATL33-like [Malania oleifera]